jgi:hypothetical protein
MDPRLAVLQFPEMTRIAKRSVRSLVWGTRPTSSSCRGRPGASDPTSENSPDPVHLDASHTGRSTRNPRPFSEVSAPTCDVKPGFASTRAGCFSENGPSRRPNCADWWSRAFWLADKAAGTGDRQAETSAERHRLLECVEVLHPLPLQEAIALSSKPGWMIFGNRPLDWSAGLVAQ